MSNVFPFRPRRLNWQALYRLHWTQRLDRLGTYLSGLHKGTLSMSALELIAPKDEPIITSAKPRVLDAPIELVWKCFSEPDYIARWWGPESLGRLVIREFDFRVGGRWRFDHELKRGPVVGFFGVYRAIEPRTKIVNTFGFDGVPPGKEAEETHLFEAKGASTLYRSVVRFTDFEGRDGMLNSGMEKGALESMRQLDEVLARLVRGAT